MSDPRTPAPPEFAAWPPIGWGCSTTWKDRLAKWRERPRKERINYPGDRLRGDPRPKSIGTIGGDNLAWSGGGCATREMEKRNSTGWGTRKLLVRGFWLLGYGKPKRIENIDLWLDRQEATSRARYVAELATLDKLRVAALDAASAIDRLALLGCEDAP